MNRFFFSLILLVALLLLGGDVHSQAFPPATRAEMRVARAQRATRNVSEPEEYLVGRAVAARILTANPLVQDPKLQLYVNEVGQTVARKSSRPKTYRGYHFAVLESPEPNAFACPGGIILITRGMLKMCANEDELAAALAHEVAHVAHRDGINSIVKSRWAEVAADRRIAAAKERGGRAAEMATLYEGSINDVFKSIATNGYSRTAEWAADQEALRTLSRAGYNPVALASLLTKMVAQEKRGVGIYRTHPPTALRLTKVNMQVKDLKPEKIQKVRDQRFKEQKI
ncbi:MAG: M48 family metalloprotease [Deltaproteobacteria bacterium]|nr:M48 family metalloprotease [Deltaproteobacteria bacterium]MBI4794408.1 M48 family metalloprotease [Deltaproteobacteria bacterium]